MLKEFENWFRTKKLNPKNLTLNIVKPPKSENTSIYADFVSKKLYARATAWESGELELEAIDAETEKTLIYDYYVIQNDEHLLALLNDFIEKLSQGSNG
jgi:hypothetical protein